jgi:hypothetical protein
MQGARRIQYIQLELGVVGALEIDRARRNLAIAPAPSAVLDRPQELVSGSAEGLTRWRTMTTEGEGCMRLRRA